MFQVLSGRYDIDRKIPKWMRSKVGYSFVRFAEDDWFENDIIREELRDVEGVVRIDGLYFYKECGKRITVDQLSQGTKQFIMMTRDPRYVVNCVHVGWNVYKYFKMWSDYKHVDVTMLMQSNGALRVPGLNGVFLNTGDTFETSNDLVDLIFRHRHDVLESDLQNWGFVTCRYSKGAREFTGIDSKGIRINYID